VVSVAAVDAQLVQDISVPCPMCDLDAGNETDRGVLEVGDQQVWPASARNRWTASF